MVGLTTTLAPVNPPGFQVYVVAPLELNVELLPEHITVGLAIELSVGVDVTIKLTVLFPTQPNVLVPFTV